MRKFSTSILIIAFACTTGFWAEAQNHAPSTPQERERAVQIAQALEANPTDPSLRNDTAWLVRWTADVPDLTVSMCSANLPWKSKYKYGTDLTAVTLAATAAFVIQHPEEGKDPAKASLAAMDAELRAYQKILDTDPEAHSKEMDELVEVQQQGKLAEYMHDRWAQVCKK